LIVAVAAVPKKKMTAYNEFMKTELPKYKEKHAGIEHKVKNVVLPDGSTTHKKKLSSY